MVLFVSATGIEIVGIKEKIRKAVVAGVEMFVNNDEGLAGDNVGVCFFCCQRDEIERGQIYLLQTRFNLPRTVNSKSEVYILTKEEELDVMLHSSTTTVHSSTSVQLT